jgi:hypothetical protein
VRADVVELQRQQPLDARYYLRMPGLRCRFLRSLPRCRSGRARECTRGRGSLLQPNDGELAATVSHATIMISRWGCKFLTPGAKPPLNCNVLTIASSCMHNGGGAGGGAVAWN